ncbi:MAG: hypothetical protein AB7U62_17685 [Pseudolabrys sp.]
MRSSSLAFLLLAFTLCAPAAVAHDHWISRGDYRNAAGELCCGENDCFVVTGVQHVTLPEPGYRLPSGEFIPESETLPSPDGAYWRCEWGGARKCFFAPPPNT